MTPVHADLHERFLGNRGRVIQKLDHYFPIYERHFSRYVGGPVTMIEIGCGLGGSLPMWRDWLGHAATVVGVDNREECRAYAGPGIHVRIGHQADPGFLRALLEEFPPDIVLDDGSHFGVDQIASFEALYPGLPSTGVYMVEDLHCSYEAHFGGGRLKPGTFIEYLKPKLDELNGDPSTPFTAITGSIHLYPSIAVFERGTAAVSKLWRRLPPRP